MSGPDRISLLGVRARGRHGVLPAEREGGQWFVVDVELELDTAPAAAEDALGLTADYASLAEAVVQVVQGEPVDLIETLASRIADTCLAVSPADAATVTVHKPQAPLPVPFDDVSVRIHRHRRG